MLTWEERRQLVKIASLYYVEGLTQEQIAKRVGVSRPIISKYLQRAKEHGIVEVFIKDESLHTVELENKLEKLFDLKDVVVVPNAESIELTKKSVGQAAANLIAKNLKKVKTIGISWGTTLAEVVKEFPYIRKDDVRVIPLVGGLGSQFVDIHANQLAYELARKLNGTCSYVYAPAFIESTELRDHLTSLPDIKSVLDEMKKADMALVGIGNPYHENSTLKRLGYLTDDDIEEFKKVGAVGDLSSRFVDINGDPITHSINDKVIGINLNEIRDIPLVIGVAVGDDKVNSVFGVLQGKYLDILIIDEFTAQAVLEKKMKNIK